MSRAVAPFTLAALCVLLAACAAVRYDPNTLPLDSRIGATTSLAYDGYSRMFADDLEKEVAQGGERIDAFRWKVNELWDQPQAIVHLSYDAQREIENGDPAAIAKVAEQYGVSAILDFQLSYICDAGKHGYAARLDVTAVLTRVEDGQVLWRRVATASSLPVDARTFKHDEPAKQYPGLLDRCVTKLLKDM